MKDRAGFIVNALLFPYLNNAVRMLDHGTASHAGHRHRHEGRLQLPARARSSCSTWSGSTRRWPSSTRCTPSSRTRTTRRCRRCGAWWRPGSSAASRAAGSTTTGRDHRGARPEPPPTHVALPRPHRRRPTTSSASAPTSSPATVLAAYRAGLFPMPYDRRRLGWWSPEPAGRPAPRRAAGHPVAAALACAATTSASTPTSAR